MLTRYINMLTFSIYFPSIFDLLRLFHLYLKTVPYVMNFNQVTGFTFF